MTSASVQAVLYENTPNEIARLIRGIGGMIRATARRDPDVTVTVDFGDSSHKPLMDPELVGWADDALQGLGASAFRYEFFSANLGSAGGNNALAQGRATDFVFVLNPDTFPCPTALLELLRRITSDPKIAIAEARQIPMEHPKSYDATTGDTSWASGACMLQRRAALREVGGYDDEHFFLHVDDVDLSWRLRLAGWRVVYVPRATVFHDKRLRPDGRPVASETEAYWALLGRLMLATRFARPDLVEQTTGSVQRNGTDSQRAAVAEFLRRTRENRIPMPLPGAEEVAAFTADEYGSRRW